jgi:hypothetical protein
LRRRKEPPAAKAILAGWTAEDAMPGKELSRWTMAWFATAFAFLVLALLGLATGWAGPGHWASGQALALAHLAGLGWLGLAMLGALIQFTPVLVARPLFWPDLALPALICLGLGCGGLALGFLGLQGWPPGLTLLSLAPWLLGLGLAMTIAMLLPTLLAACGWRNAAGRMVLAGLFALLLVWITGASMAEALAGQDFGAALLPDGLPLHILLALGGWLSLSAFGVSYRLFAMFLLAPDTDGRLRRATFGLGILALVTTCTALGLVLQARTPILIVPILLAVLVAVLFLFDIRRLWQSGKRPQVEVNMQMTRLALLWLALALPLALAAAFRGGIWAEAAIFALMAGWLSLLTLAQMIKIVSFLTWIQVFAPCIGRSKVPMVQALTHAAQTRRWLRLWAIGTALGTLGLLAQTPGLFRAAAALLLVAALGILIELRSIRRCQHLAPDQRPAQLPPLILPPPPRSSAHGPNPFHA